MREHVCKWGFFLYSNYNIKFKKKQEKNRIFSNKKRETQHTPLNENFSKALELFLYYQVKKKHPHQASKLKTYFNNNTQYIVYIPIMGYTIYSVFFIMNPARKHTKKSSKKIKQVFFVCACAGKSPSGGVRGRTTKDNPSKDHRDGPRHE